MIPDGWIIGIVLFGGAYIMSLFVNKIALTESIILDASPEIDSNR